MDRDKLIGVQHYDDPQLRLLALWDAARKKDLHLYAAEDKLFCSPDGPRPPKEYVEDAIGQLPYDLDQKGSCGHDGAADMLRVRWKVPGILISICSDCAEEMNSAHILAGRVAAVDPLDDFEVEIETVINCLSSCDECVTKKAAPLGRELDDRYIKGELNDKQILEEHEREMLRAIRSSKKAVLIIGTDCYGHDRNKFIERIRGSAVEKEALSGLISKIPICIISSSDQAANIISDLWDEHREELLGEVASPEVVEQVMGEHSGLTPSQVVAEAERIESSKAIVASLPKYQKLGSVGKLSDSLARTYKTEGKEAVLRQIDKFKGNDHELRSTSFAFCVALGEGHARSWQFTKEEIDFGEHLADAAKALLEAQGEDYDRALRQLVAGSGAVEETVRN